MKKILALVVVAAMGLPSAVLVAETVTIPALTATITKAAPAKTTHHKKQHKAAPVQKAQATKKHRKNAKAEQRAPEQKAQVAKEHAGKHSHQQSVKPAAQPAV